MRGKALSATWVSTLHVRGGGAKRSVAGCGRRGRRAAASYRALIDHVGSTTLPRDIKRTPIMAAARTWSAPRSRSVGRSFFRLGRTASASRAPGSSLFSPPRCPENIRDERPRSGRIRHPARAPSRSQSAAAGNQPRLAAVAQTPRSLSSAVRISAVDILAHVPDAGSPPRCIRLTGTSAPTSGSGGPVAGRRALQNMAAAGFAGPRILDLPAYCVGRR